MDNTRLIKEIENKIKDATRSFREFEFISKNEGKLTFTVHKGEYLCTLSTSLFSDTGFLEWEASSFEELVSKVYSEIDDFLVDTCVYPC